MSKAERIGADVAPVEAIATSWPRASASVFVREPCQTAQTVSPLSRLPIQRNFVMS